MSKSLLFINGEAPSEIPDISDFQMIACTDGAFHYLEEMDFPLEKLSFISGDFDSFQLEKDFGEKYIHTPDQDKTDFHKALEILLEKGSKEVCVYGASGKEQDHFLGNLHTAYLFKNHIDIKFFDEYSTYYFIPNKIILEEVEGKMISLVPFPIAEGIITKGLNWELCGETLSLLERIGARNFAKEKTVEIEYKDGVIVVFEGKNKYR